MNFIYEILDNYYSYARESYEKIWFKYLRTKDIKWHAFNLFFSFLFQIFQTIFGETKKLISTSAIYRLWYIIHS